jgi:hypothetical protein
MSAMSDLLERPPVAPAARISPQPQVYGWRFPAEFRARPVGWTERKRPALPAPPQEASPGSPESSVGYDAARKLTLDRGPEGLAGATAHLLETDSSNACSALPAAMLAFAAPPARTTGEDSADLAPPLLLDRGPPAGLPATRPSHETRSNAGPTPSARELGAVTVAPRQEAATVLDFLAIGEPVSWLSPPRMPGHASNEASYASS